MKEGQGVGAMSSGVRREREEAAVMEKGGRSTPLLAPEGLDQQVEEAMGKLSLLDEDDNALWWTSGRLPRTSVSGLSLLCI